MHPYSRSRSRSAPSAPLHGGAGGSFASTPRYQSLANVLFPSPKVGIKSSAKDWLMSDFKSGADDLLSSAKDIFSGDTPSGPTYSELTADKGGSQPQTFDYLDAPWSSAYGMSKETAYAEAMENTAYRRSVADMQKAGLNPAVIFGAGNGYTAGSPSYISSARSGGSGSGGSGSGRRSGSRSSKSSNNGKLFSGSAYSIISALGGIVGAAATHSAGGYWIGTSLAQGAMSALNAFSGGRR